jgi:hypothetical protein
LMRQVRIPTSSFRHSREGSGPEALEGPGFPLSQE